MRLREGLEQRNVGEKKESRGRMRDSMLGPRRTWIGEEVEDAVGPPSSQALTFCLLQRIANLPHSRIEMKRAHRSQFHCHDDRSRPSPTSLISGARGNHCRLLILFINLPSATIVIKCPTYNYSSLLALQPTHPESCRIPRLSHMCDVQG